MTTREKVKVTARRINERERVRGEKKLHK